MRTRNLLLAAVLLAGCAGQSGSSPLSLDGTWSFQVMESLGCDAMPSSFLAGGDPQIFAVSQTGADVAAQFVDNDGALCTLDGTFHPDDFLGTLTVAGGARTVVFSAEGFARVRNGRPQVDGTLRVVSDTEDLCLGAIVVFCADIQQGAPADVDLPPTLVFFEPGEGTTVPPGETVVIEYADDDPDSVATTSLYAGQIPIALDRPERNGATQTFQWDTSGIPPGTYRIRAETTDGNTTITTEAPGLITIEAAGGGEPVLGVTVPGSDLRFCPGAVVNVTYFDTGAGTTSVYADPDGDLGTTAGQIAIATDRPANDGSPQTVPWDTEGVALNTYFIMARASDGRTETAAGTAELVAPATLMFARLEGGAGRENARGIASFPDGSWVITGGMSDAEETIFGRGDANETSLTRPGMYVARYNADGTLAWARTTSGPADSADFALGVDAFADGTCVVVGTIGGPTRPGASTFGTGEANETTLTPNSGNDAFVARYAADGDLLWARSFGANFHERPLGVAALGDGSCVVTGEFRNPITLGAGEPGETTLTSAGGVDIFIARYAANGDLVWATSAGVHTNDGPLAITHFPDDSFVVSGFLGDSDNRNIYLARYNADNTLAWERTDGDIALFRDESWSAIDAFDDGSFACAGFYRGVGTTLGVGDPNETTFDSDGELGGILVARYNADGSLAWARQARSLANARAIATAPDGTVIVAGGGEPITFGPGEPVEITTDRTGAFLAYYNADGSVRCARVDGGGFAAYGVTLLPDGSVVTAGLLGAAPAVFGAGEPNETTFTSLGLNDIFIARYGN